MEWLTLDMTKDRQLREKVLLEYGAVQSLRAVAKANSVSKSTVSNWVAKARGIRPPAARTGLQHQMYNEN